MFRFTPEDGYESSMYDNHEVIGKIYVKNGVTVFVQWKLKRFEILWKKTLLNQKDCIVRILVLTMVKFWIENHYFYKIYRNILYY